jgi:RNA polymerase sigma-70 factor (ECF subfamily)
MTIPRRAGACQLAALYALDDVALLQLVIDGDARAVGALYARTAPALFRIAFAVLRDRADAEDVVHDAFASIRERAVGYVETRGRVVAWLSVVVRNLAIDRKRRAQRRAALAALAELPVAATTGNPEHATSDAARVAALRSALAKLPDLQRRTLEAAFFEDLTYPEIARRDSTQLGTIKSRAARAQSALRHLLRDEVPEYVPSEAA